MSDSLNVCTRRSLRADGIFCALVGLAAIVLAVPLGDLFGTSWRVPAVIGVLTIAWAACLRVIAPRARGPRVLRLVAVANAVAAVGILALALLADGAGARLTLIALAVCVGAFAVAQVRLVRGATAD